MQSFKSLSRHVPKCIVFAFLVVIVQGCDFQKSNTLFEEVPARRSKINFKNTLGETEEFNVLKYGYFYNGGGVAIGDINNDGLPDIYLTGNMKASHLYLNKGNMKFEEIAEKAGVEAAGLWNTGVTMADVNNDGWLDIYVCRSAANLEIRRKNLLFINNRDLTFTESAALFGLDDGGYSTQAAFFDYDRDGDLDMYMLNHSVQEYAGFSNLLKSQKTKISREYGDRLYRNDLIPTETESLGRFLNVTHQAGILNTVLGFGLGVAIEDINGDGWLDIYVSNDYNEEDYCYINQQDGTFKESIREYFDHTSLFSMGSDVADINNDGLPEVYTLDMLPEDNYRIKMTSGSDNFDKKEALYQAGFHYQSMRNMLHLNNGDGSFSEIGQLSGISNTDWSWAALFADFDLDGWKDLFVTNGYKSDYTNMEFMSYATDQIQAMDPGDEPGFSDLLAKIPSISLANYIYRNNGDLTFEDMTSEWGLGKELLSNGAAFADLDVDGDLDLVINNVNEITSVYQNNSNALIPHHYLKLQFRNAPLNKFGVGTSAKIVAGDLIQYQTLMPTRGYQSAVEHILTFGLGDKSRVDRIEITWPDGNKQILEDRQSDQLITVHYNPLSETDDEPSSQEKIFTDVSEEYVSSIRHTESLFNDFKIEPLIPHMLSTQGPALSVGDVNGDALDDIFLGGAKGYAGQIYLQNTDGSFQKRSQSAFTNDKESEDVQSILLDVDGDGDNDLYVASGSNEEDAPDLYQDRIYINNGKGDFSRMATALPRMEISTGVVKADDIDNDGDPDLFVGGRLVPGEYPASPRSFLLENDGRGTFKDITAETNPELGKLGMVTGAQWVHLNDDDHVDLVIAGEWMPIRFFINAEGRFVEKRDVLYSESDSLMNTNGWWNCLHSADMDGDGDIDFVAGNFGLNSQIKAGQAEPVSVLVKDFDNNGTLDPIFSYFNLGKRVPLAPRDDLLSQLPSLKKKFESYEDYARAGTDDLFDATEREGATELQAHLLSSVYIENIDNESFRIIPLPLEAQMSPVHSILIDDFDRDGNQDILLGGNFTDSKVQFGRYDANKGTLLLGDGDGKFQFALNKSSGLLLKGDVREIKQIEINNLGKAIVIGKNDDQLQLLDLLEPDEL